MNWTVLVQHLLISLVPWLGGVVVGGGLGYICALVGRRLFSARPGLRRLSMLLPWRTIVVNLLLLYSVFPIILRLIGVPVRSGVPAQAAIVCLWVLPLAFAFTAVVLFESWYSSPLVVRLIAGVRTLATASVAVAAATQRAAGRGSIGVSLYPTGYPQVISTLSTVVLLTLMVDVLIGALQLPFSRSSMTAKPAQTAIS